MSTIDAYRALCARLSPQQVTIVTNVSDAIKSKRTTPFVVDATAGSGKTTVMIATIAWLVNERILPAGDILLTTFTRKAREEMEERLTAVMPFNTVGGRTGVKVSTFHALAIGAVWARRTHPMAKRVHEWSHAFNIDTSPRERAGAAAKLTGPLAKHAEQARWIRLDEVWEAIARGGDLPGLGRVQSVKERFGEDADPMYLQRSIEVSRAWGFRADSKPNPGKEDLSDPMVQYAWALYDKVKAVNRMWDFADALDVYQGLVHTKNASYKLVMNDEAQDNTWVQTRIALGLAANAGGLAVFVGDPNQSIYAFRGADVESMVKMAQGESNLLGLTVNYRSAAAIVEAANRIVRDQPWALTGDAQAHRQNEGHIQYVQPETPGAGARLILEAISKAVRAGTGVQWSDFAILSRLRRSLGVFEAASLILEVPVRIRGASPFFSLRNKPIAAIMSVIRLADGTSPPDQLRRDLDVIRRFGLLLRAATLDQLWTTKLSRGPVRELAALAQAERKKMNTLRGPDNLRKLDTFVSVLETAAADSKTGDAVTLVRTLVGMLVKADVISLGEKEKDRGDEGEEEGKKKRKGKKDKDLDGAEESDAEAVAALLEIAEAVTTVPNLIRLSLRGLAADQAEDEDPNKVTVSTIHGVKGLEYKTVFLLAPKDRGGDQDEERRIFYVGVTRARDELVVVGSAEGFSKFVADLRGGEGAPKPKEPKAEGHRPDDGQDLLDDYMPPPEEVIDDPRGVVFLESNGVPVESIDDPGDDWSWYDPVVLP